MKRTLCSWSGGKDSCFALMQAIAAGYQPEVLLNVLNEEGKISSVVHGHIMKPISPRPCKH
jgi:diphthamide synthase (EF-2-diphthine--ammonia ligase)